VVPATSGSQKNGQSAGKYTPTVGGMIMVWLSEGDEAKVEQDSNLGTIEGCPNILASFGSLIWGPDGHRDMNR
jgi:hypothetical protein